MARLARGHGDHARLEPRLREAGQQRGEVQRRHRLVRHHHEAAPGQHGPQQGAGAGEQTLADQHLVAAAERHRQAARRPPVLQRAHHLAGGGLRPLLAAVHDHVGLRIGGIALPHEAAQRVAGLAGVEQRAVGAPGGAAHQHVEPAAQPHGDRARPDRGPGARVHEGAAAGGEHHGGARQQAADHAALAVAEVRLAVALEDLGDGGAGGELDLGVGVAERQPEAGGQAPPDGGLARPHQPHQHHAAAVRRAGGEPGRRGGGGRVRGGSGVPGGRRGARGGRRGVRGRGRRVGGRAGRRGRGWGRRRPRPGDGGVACHGARG